MNLEALSKQFYNKNLNTCSKEEVYYLLLNYTKEHLANAPKNQGDKKLYYFSMEFLIGKLLSNNLINLGIYDDVAMQLKNNGFAIEDIEGLEPEPSLGNGGLGRLAACFLDSIANLSLNGDGVGLNYQYGLFKQSVANNAQIEDVDPWIENNSWLTNTEKRYDVKFSNGTVVTGLLKQISIPGFTSAGVNKLNLFELEHSNHTINEGINFDKEDIKNNLTLFLYPDDSDKNGKLLRIYQEYFLVSCGAQLVLEEYFHSHKDIRKIADHVVIQINDTHPSMVIPELIRLFKIHGVGFYEAYDIVSKMVAYTNHTILAEALEKWPYDDVATVNNDIALIIKRISIHTNRIRKMKRNCSCSIVQNDYIHMAFMDVHMCFSVNGVAKLHTDILKNDTLSEFYEMYPEKFNNKTNGITFRRWLTRANPELANLIASKISNDYEKDAMELEKLLEFKNDNHFLKQLRKIKNYNKVEFKNYILEKQNVHVNPNSIFDVQIKRFHEYKRQQMNALYIVHKYMDIKNGKFPKTPITFIFSGKAAPAYYIAKDIIHFINCLSSLIDDDPVASKYLKIVFVEDYSVSAASKIIPAADISEQISLASKEASGTGNMKLMLNGAITLGTMDGANVEIHDLVGPENIFIFGKSSKEVISLYQSNSYNSYNIYSKDRIIKKIVDFIVSDEIVKYGNMEMLRALHNEILDKDYFMTLLDLKSFIDAKEEIYNAYEDKHRWSQMALVNIAKAGYFSSDRTIADYNKDIWGLK